MDLLGETVGLGAECDSATDWDGVAGVEATGQAEPPPPPPAHLRQDAEAAVQYLTVLRRVMERGRGGGGGQGWEQRAEGGGGGGQGWEHRAEGGGEAAVRRAQSVCAAVMLAGSSDSGSGSDAAAVSVPWLRVCGLPARVFQRCLYKAVFRLPLTALRREVAGPKGTKPGGGGGYFNPIELSSKDAVETRLKTAIAGGGGAALVGVATAGVACAGGGGGGEHAGGAAGGTFRRRAAHAAPGAGGAGVPRPAGRAPGRQWRVQQSRPRAAGGRALVAVRLAAVAHVVDE
jgi:hypothetical protein